MVKKIGISIFEDQYEIIEKLAKENTIPKSVVIRILLDRSLRGLKSNDSIIFFGERNDADDSLRLL